VCPGSIVFKQSRLGLLGLRQGGLGVATSSPERRQLGKRPIDPFTRAGVRLAQGGNGIAQGVDLDRSSRCVRRDVCRGVGAAS
jgi:hypothetical protein